MKNLKRYAVMMTIFTVVCLIAVLSFNNLLWAASCTADCAGGSVTCNGATCNANDNVGCSATDANGNLTQTKECNLPV
jgi:hypothetical protein